MIFFPKSKTNELSPVKEKLNKIFFLQMAFMQNNKKWNMRYVFTPFVSKKLHKSNHQNVSMSKTKQNFKSFNSQIGISYALIKAFVWRIKYKSYNSKTSFKVNLWILNFVEMNIAVFVFLSIQLCVIENLKSTKRSFLSIEKIVSWKR